jgi:predicted outer membrane repeat protein
MKKRFNLIIMLSFIVLFKMILVEIKISYASIIRVPGDYTTIQKAIDSAVDGDIVEVADGTYTDVGNKDISFLGKAITVKSENGPEHCVIDCDGNGRGFVFFHSGELEDSVLLGFTIANGSHVQGGAVLCFNSSPTIKDCIFINNEAEYTGGAIYLSDSNSKILNCACV